MIFLQFPAQIISHLCSKSLTMKTLLFLLFSLVLSAVQAQSCTCCSAPYQQFDFWIGEWKVSGPVGKEVGQNTIEKIENGCVLQEHWRSTNGFTGTSFSYYDSTDQSWNQLWLDSQGGNLILKGSLEGNAMRLNSAFQFDPALEKYYVDLITWTPLEDGSVEQHWERVYKDSEERTTVFIGTYRKE